MSFFDDNLPIMAAFAIAAPEVFGAEIAGQGAVAEGATAEAAAQQEAARQAAQEAARQEAAKQAAASQSGIMGAGGPQLSMNTGFGQTIPEIGQLPQAGPGTQQAGLGTMYTQAAIPPTPPMPNPAMEAGPSFVSPETAANASSNVGGSAAPRSALQNGFDSFSKFAKESPYLTAGAGYVGAYNLGLLDPRTQSFNAQSYNGPLNSYRLSPDFRGSTVNPQNYQYAPRYADGGIMSAAGGGPVEQMSNNAAIGANTMYPMANMTTSSFATPYQTPVSSNMIAPSGGATVNAQTGELNPQGTRLAAGGIASYAKGGNLSSTLDYYSNMIEGPAGHQIAEMQTPTAGSHDVGIYRDVDPDTMYLSAPEAAQVRMGKINARTYMQGKTLPRMGHQGTINLKPQGGDNKDQSNVQDAAQGGIMQASGHLGGYAAGGQPRLLKGPGDGMSDNIPAVIANKQPARLADGEFVVPADVVSHLGNGSTDAGAKKLHGMMDNVRKARTGRKAQGKQINPDKYMPK